MMATVIEMVIGKGADSLMMEPYYSMEWKSYLGIEWTVDRKGWQWDGLMAAMTRMDWRRVAMRWLVDEKSQP